MSFGDHACATTGRLVLGGGFSSCRGSVYGKYCCVPNGVPMRYELISKKN